MPKFYVQSGQVQVILDAQDAEQAAITAFQWWCERQAEAMFDAFDDDADDRQLGNEILVSEAGFGAVDAESFQTSGLLIPGKIPWPQFGRRGDSGERVGESERGAGIRELGRIEVLQQVANGSIQTRIREGMHPHPKLPGSLVRQEVCLLRE